jgi:ferredoxin-thioredoxin reductase catalytic subunit
MNDEIKISQEDISHFWAKLNDEALTGGYNLNPDKDFTRTLIEGLLVNQGRYGYPSCPCRRASGKKADDLDIICPCDYRDPDLDEYGTCYCALYLSNDAVSGKMSVKSIPERRPDNDIHSEKRNQLTPEFGSLKYPVWRCKVCGYLCARDNPPGVCPICKAEKERFEKFM